jgi:hypothetical protein
MKTYEIIIEGNSKYFKSEAESHDIQTAIDFIKNGEVQLDKLLQALRMLGFKATQVKIDPVDIFEV